MNRNETLNLHNEDLSTVARIRHALELRKAQNAAPALPKYGVCTREVAEWLDPTGQLRKLGLLRIEQGPVRFRSVEHVSC